MPNSTELAENFAAYHQATLVWRAWTTTHGLTSRTATRTVHGTRQELPTHVFIPDIDAAAGICGSEWPTRLHRARCRGKTMHHEFPHLADLARTIRDTDAYSDIDFDLLLATARWFAVNSAAGLTPRQVPVPGLHAKWLTNRHRIVACLAGIPDLQLLPPHPPRIHFTYLDPDHRDERRSVARQRDGRRLRRTRIPSVRRGDLGEQGHRPAFSSPPWWRLR